MSDVLYVDNTLLTYVSSQGAAKEASSLPSTCFLSFTLSYITNLMFWKGISAMGNLLGGR